MSDHDYDEKRDFVRMSIETKVTYTVKNSDGQTHHGESGNLSATGLSMQTDFALSENDEIDIIMNPNGERLPPFVAEGKVIRVIQDENNAELFQVSVTLTKTA